MRPMETADAPATIRVLLADDQALVRGALAALLDLEPDLAVVAEVSDGTEVLNAVREHRIDVAILDIEMPGMDVIDAMRTIRDAGATEEFTCRGLIVTPFGRPGYLRRAFDAGASGFIVKDTPAEELADAVRTVHSGGRVVDPALAQESIVTGHNPLTERERDVLRAALTGAGARDIAATLCLSPGTVRNHLSSAIAKTHTSNRSEAAAAAREKGWL